MKRLMIGLSSLLALCGCGGGLPNMDLRILSGGGAGAVSELSLQSEPEGADARTSLGPACRTPCAVTVAARGEFSVSFSLSGYETQTVAVRIEQPRERFDPDSPVTARFAPNPVFAELQPVPPPRRSRRRSTKRPQPPPQAAPVARQPAAQPR